MALKIKNISRAKNNQKSVFSYRNRKIYKDEQFIVLDDTTKPIDLWYDKPMYGLVNHENQPVYLSSKYVKQISSTEDNLFVVNFVADAFEDFKSVFLRERATNKLAETNSPMLDIDPVRAWVSPRNLYSDYLKLVYKNYIVKFYPNHKRSKKIENFGDFAESFMSYIRDVVVASKSPFTLSAFLLNRTVSPLASGLMIDLSDDDSSDDEKKANAFLRDPSFRFYKGLAKKYGFRLDKNSPWRLIADLSSPGMRDYMSNYGISSVNKVFNTLYVRTVDEDFELMKEFFVKSYAVFVPTKPYEKTTEYCPDTGSSRAVFKRKTPASKSDIEREYGDDFWIKMYFDVRLMETGYNIPKAKYNIILNNALRMQRVLDINLVLGYIDEYVNLRDPQRK
jgi:hypothetical protein|tara:strand:- start:237 stop:1415 length:1179 start_codon:yes stop_codon:yes gene_type:complete